MARVLGMIASCIVLLACAFTTNAQPTLPVYTQSGTVGFLGSAASSAGSPTIAPWIRTCGVTYQGGPIMHDTINIYIIYFGTADPLAVQMVSEWASNIGSTNRWKMMSAYTDMLGRPVSPVVQLGASPCNFPGGSLVGKTYADILDLVVYAAASWCSNFPPIDSNGLYYLIPAKSIALPSVITSSTCGYHTYGTGPNNTALKYAFTPFPTGDCIPPLMSPNSPHGDSSSDALINMMQHALDKMATDPIFTGWKMSSACYHEGVLENGDYCANTWGPTYVNALTGSPANIRLGYTDYLIQGGWQPQGMDCRMSSGPLAILDMGLPTASTCDQARAACVNRGGRAATREDLTAWLSAGGEICDWSLGMDCYKYLVSQGHDPNNCGDYGINPSNTYYGTADHMDGGWLVNNVLCVVPV